MNRPTEEQQRRGCQVSAEMFNASMAQAFESAIDFESLEFPDLVQQYLNGEIDSVTGIYLAMQVDSTEQVSYNTDKDRRCNHEDV